MESDAGFLCFRAASIASKPGCWWDLRACETPWVGNGHPGCVTQVRRTCKCRTQIAHASICQSRFLLPQFTTQLRRKARPALWGRESNPIACDR